MRLKLFFGKRTLLIPTRSYEVEVYEAQSTTELRTIIYRLTNVPPERQQILGLKGGVLRGDAPLSALSIYDGQKIVLMELKTPTSVLTPSVVSAPVAAAIAKAAARRPPRGAVVSTNMTECLNFMELPGELQSMVISFLTPVEVGRTASVSKVWKDLVDDELMWKDCFARRYRVTHISSPPASWKALYARRYRSEVNIIGSHFKSQLLSRVPSSAVCALKEDSPTVFFAADREIIHFELPSAKFPEGRRVRVLKGHQESINALCLKQNCLISGSMTGNLLLWDTEKDPTPLPWHRRSVEYVGTLRGHHGAITGLLLDDAVTTLVTADGVIFVHDLKTGSMVHQYGIENTAAVEGIALSGNRLISITVDKIVRTWNLAVTGDDVLSQHPSPLANTGNYVSMHLCEALHLLTIATEQAVEVWDTHLWRLQHVVRQQGVQCVTNDGRYLWMGSAQGLFVHYEGKVIQIDANVQDARNLMFRGDSLIVCSRGVLHYDFTVKPTPPPAAATRVPVFSDEAGESDAPDEMQPLGQADAGMEEDDF